jgi:Fe-S cluster assembly protein SufD
MTTTDTARSSRIAALSEGSPSWLAELRRAGSDAYADIPYPQGREEVWRFTDVRSIHPDNFTPTTDPATPKLEGESSDGVIFCDLDSAVRDHPDLLKDRLGSLVGSTDPFTALSLAAHSGGTFLYVPKGAVVEAPLHATHTLTADDAGTAVLPRTVVVVEEGARVVFNDVYTSGPLAAPTLAAPVTEMFIGKGAEVGWVTWQDWGPGVKHVANVRAHLDRDALLNTLVVTLGGDYSRTWKECTMAGENAQSYMYGLYFSHGDQRFEHWTLQDHVAPHCTSDLLYKGALADASQALYYGKIHIRPNGHHSDAYQANRNLALSDKARALPNPQLEIENNEVRCTHGATVGRVSDEHLFYLRSRGISEDEARKLIVFGFFNQVLDRVGWSGMQDQLSDAIRTKMEV